ncbi:hypothetical protein [Pseudobdellovibrio exovorus]|uniref:Uncharacterized protein n=1 Tax=Pseudobdellovibrio exovorus JSS TaxID=1184267 RepID=M4V936_9BACT|nr:hypothetical protein [Pseudobdellovibrio exovorus]AGH95733.1 hypothetical protein A11Q_1517 [Pseudobdellovibrio exovorus JSS]
MSKAGLVLKEATREDSQKLGEFFTSIPILGEIAIKIQREQHFFSFYQRLGLPYKSYIIKDGDEVVGTASFVFRHLNFQTRTLKLAQACDLRISSNRKVIMSWLKFFHPILEQLRETEHCDGFITSINQTETQAMNAFIRPKLKRAHQPQYSLSRSYNLASIHGFYPLLNPPNKNILVRAYQTSDKKKLIEYIQANCKRTDFAPKELIEDVAKYIDTSLIYSWNQFLIAFDSNNNIVGCAHPISSSLLQDYLPQDYSPQSHNLRQFLKVAQFLGFGRRLTRPFSRSQKQEALSFRLLHFLLSSHPEVFNALIHMCYKTSSQNEFLMYAYETTDYKRRPPKGSIYSEIPYGLYSIETHDREFLPELSLLNTTPAWLDFIWF